MSLNTDLVYNYVLELTDRATQPMLKAQRLQQTAIEKQSKAMDLAAKAATASGDKQVKASERAATAYEQAQRAAVIASKAVQDATRATADQAATAPRATSALDRLASRYSLLGRAAKDAAQHQETAARRSRAAVSSMAKDAESLSRAGGRGLATAATAGGAAAGIGLAVGVTQAASFEQAMARVNAKLLTTKTNQDALKKAALDFGAATVFSNNEVAGAMDELASAGYSTNQILKMLPGTLSLAAASGATLSQSAEIQTSTLHQFGLAAGDATKVADLMAQTANRTAADVTTLQDAMKYAGPVAKNFGISLNDTVTAVGLLANQGMEASQIGTTLRTAMVRLTAPTTKAQGALASLGLAAKDLHGPKGLLPLPELLGKFVKASQGVSVNTRNAALATIFGREALSGMVALVAAGPKKFDKLAGALDHSGGAAKRAADIVNSTTQSAWHNFTGSVESAASTLLNRFSPAAQNALQYATDLVNVGAKSGAGFIAGLAGQGTPSRAAKLRPNDPDRLSPATGPSGAQKLGAEARRVAMSIYAGVKGVGKQLVDALKPAEPFLRNVLIPLLKGVAIGVLGGVVGAFKVAVPVVKLLATVLGYIGTAARPIAPVFKAIGEVIGLLFGGVWLKAISEIDRMRGAFKLLPPVARLLLVPLNLLNKVFEFVGAAAMRFGALLVRASKPIMALAAMIVRVWVKAHVEAAKAIAGVVGSVGGAATKVAGAILRGLGAAAGAATRVGKWIADVPGSILGVLGRVGEAASTIGHAIVNGIVNAIKSAPGAIVGALSSIVPGPVKKVLKGASGIVGDIGGLFGGRAGGRLHHDGFRRYQAGGLVPALVSSGEMLGYPDGTMSVVPGARVAADNVMAMLPPGTAVLTDHGQALLGAGASLDQAIRMQMPHFAAGGIVKGKVSTFGPPGERTGITASGATTRTQGIALNIHPGTDQGWNNATTDQWVRDRQKFTVTVNGHTAVLPVIDKGPAGRTGRAIDITGAGVRKMGLNPLSFPTDAIGTATMGGSSAAAVGSTTSKTTVSFADRVGDAFGAGYDLGLGGASRIGGSLLSSIARSSIGKYTTTTSSTLAAGGSLPGGAIGSTRLSGHPEVKAAASRAAQTLIARFPGLSVSSTTGGNHVSGSYHYQGRAVDLAGPQSVMDRAGAWAQKNISGGLLEGIHNATLAVKNGRVVNGPSVFSSVWAGHRDHVHVAARRGGIIPRFRTGGVIGGAVGDVLGAKGSHVVAASRSLAGLLSNTETLAEARLLTLMHHLARQVSQIRAAGHLDTVKGRRLAAVLDLVDAEVGRRIGHTVAAALAWAGQLTQRSGNLDFIQRSTGISGSSSAGLQMALAGGVADRTDLRKQATLYTSAIKRAQKAGQAAKVAELETALKDVNSQITESVLQTAENTRALIIAKAQEQTSASQFGVDWTNANLAFLDASQRVSGAAGSPDALRGRANALSGALVPQLAGLVTSLQAQARASLSVGDLEGARTAMLSATQAATDLATAQADAADLIRQAAENQADAIVATADFGSSVAQAHLTAIETRQQLLGTADTPQGKLEVAASIRDIIMPALQAAVSAAQQKVDAEAAQRGVDSAEWRAAVLSLLGAQNDLAQAQVDAQDATTSAVNDQADALKEFAGSNAFEFNGQSFTDIINLGVGA